MIESNKQIPLSRLLALAAAARSSMRNSGVSLQSAVEHAAKTSAPQEKGAIQSILYATVRNHSAAAAIIKRLASKKPRSPYYEVLEIAVSLIIEDSYAPFVVVDQAVECIKTQSRIINASSKLSSFVNGVLRSFLRQKKELLKEVMMSPAVRFNVPEWWLNKLRSSHPNDWEKILELQRRKPPLTLRVNALRTTVPEYRRLLEEHGFTVKVVGRSAVVVEPALPVQQIPGFMEGLASVQDAGAQLAAQILPLKDGFRVLDACAAPGGKTAHIMETCRVSMTAFDIEQSRTRMINENLSRLGLSADVKAKDAADLDSWWDGEQFDAVLIDAPCTSSGVVRRLPDVPWSRTPEDVANLSRRQREILESLWPVVKTGGYVLFATCSIFPEEGSDHVEAFTRTHSDAKIVPIFGSDCLTLLPGDEDREYSEGLPSVHDGFFYALFQKV